MINSSIQSLNLEFEMFIKKTNSHNLDDVLLQFYCYCSVLILHWFFQWSFWCKVVYGYVTCHNYNIFFSPAGCPLLQAWGIWLVKHSLKTPGVTGGLRIAVQEKLSSSLEFPNCVSSHVSHKHCTILVWRDIMRLTKTLKENLMKLSTTTTK